MYNVLEPSRNLNWNEQGSYQESKSKIVVDCSRCPQNLISRRFLGEDDKEMRHNEKGTCSVCKTIVVSH